MIFSRLRRTRLCVCVLDGLSLMFVTRMSSDQLMPLLVCVCVKLDSSQCHLSDRVCVFQVVVDTNGSDFKSVIQFFVYDSEHVISVSTARNTNIIYSILVFLVLRTDL